VFVTQFAGQHTHDGAGVRDVVRDVFRLS
jgi:hypothetical protein